MAEAFPKEPTRRALTSALPGIEPRAASDEEIAFTYVPPSHARAIDPDNVLVEGIRGSGKSFWWNALNREEHRRFVIAAFPETRLRPEVKVGPGYGVGPVDERFPSKDIIQSLAVKTDPRNIWKSVVASHLRFPAPFPCAASWGQRAEWVSSNAELYDQFLRDADRRLVEQGATYLLLFDALDRLASDWVALRPIARALLQIALDYRSLRAVRLKLFVRPDMIADREIMAFPDASKLVGQKVALTWRRIDLYGLMFQCLGNAPDEGERMRGHSWEAFGARFAQAQAGVHWLLPQALRKDEELQREMVHAITGPHMASGPSGHKRGFPYSWLPNHLADGAEQVSPRSFSAALREAAQIEAPIDWPYPLHFSGLKAGVQVASRIRVDELALEDYPWVHEAMRPLRDLVVPCEVAELKQRWERAGTVETLQSSQHDKLPPAHLDEKSDGLIKDLRSLGIVQMLSDGRVQMPDVYRIAFGLGRRGGVKPIS